MTRRRMTGVLMVCALLALFPPSASAQTGPMVVQRLHSGFVVAPDVKLSEVDDRAAALAGGYAGWLSDETVFIGGGAYVLANQASDRKMAYAGLVMQFLTRADRRVGFGVTGLIGGGRATLAATLSEALRLPELPNLRDLSPLRIDLGQLLRQPPTPRLVQREGFLIAEPQFDVIVRLARQFRLTGGVGYRLIDAEGRFDNRLRGASGSVALRIGGGF